MRKVPHILSVALAGFSLWGAAQADDTPPPAARPAACPARDPTIICGDSAAEDLRALPGTNWVVASAYAGAGGLRLIDSVTRRTVKLRFRAGVDDAHDRKAFPTCPGPLPAKAHDILLTHGLDVADSRDGIHTLYAVHHDARESIEIFRIDTRQAEPSLTWIGCVVAPGKIGLNSVAALPDGGFVTTNFLPRGGDMESDFAALTAGKDSGELWTWHRDSGWAQVRQSRGSGLNGVAASPDGKTLYAASWGQKSLIRLLRDGTGRTSVPLGFRVDNVQWNRDGRLMAAGQTEAGSKAVLVDPQSLAVTQLAEFADTPVFSSASVGLQNGDDVWLGSYGAHNIAVVKARAMPPSAATR